MINFKLDCQLCFEAENIKEAREKIKHLNFILRELYRTEIKLSKTEDLFSKEDL